MNEYRNDVRIDYEKSIKLNTINNIIFLIHLIFLSVNCYREIIPKWIIVTLCIVYVLLSFINDLFILNKAEKERRKTLLSNAYKKDLSDKITKKYYNNSISPSLKKLGVNSFESSYYTKENLSMMLKTESIKIIFVIVVFITFISLSDNKSFLLLLIEVLLSTDVMYKYIKMVYYKNEVNCIYSIFYSIFITNKYESDNEAELLCNIIDYECIKNYCHIQLSESNFKKINNTKFDKWKEIRNKIK